MTVDAVRDIFRRVLEPDASSVGPPGVGAPGIGADSDFFALGGDSLLATRVLSAVARECGVELTFDDLLRAPTPAGLAGTIARTIASVPR
ncbi:MAG: acyl carrier protein [Micromonosporaceae bacterium]|nr:acyl carrier protein [Micromonosporaceae bacterium]